MSCKLIPEHFGIAQCIAESGMTESAIGAANADAVKIFKDYESKKRELEQVAKQEGLQERNGSKVMKPFNMEIITKGNNHGKIRFIADSKERFIGTEASSGSDSLHGAKNEASDVTKALLW